MENKKRLEDAFKTADGSAPRASRLILGQKLDDVKRSSKVVDAEGRPLVVHHNTDAVFDTFSKDKINSRGAYGEGFYFAEQPAPYGPHQMDVYLKGTYGLPEKRAARRAGQPVQELDYVHVPDKGYWMVKEPNQIKSVQNRGTFNPDDPNIYRALPWAAGGAGTAAALAPGEAYASVPADQYRFPADEPGYVNREPGLGTPLVDVADLATAPVGAVTAAGRAASVLAEPVISWGMDKAGNWLGDRLGGLLGYFGGEE